METHKTLVQTKVIQPKILYYGTPVVLLNTLNEDGTTNISPISSSWCLGDSLILGVGIGGKAYENLQRTPECVINLPSPELWQHVERLAPYTGKEEVPISKKNMGFSYKKDKYKAAHLTPAESTSVLPSRISECPIQVEAVVRSITVPDYSPEFAIIQAQAVKVHAHENIIANENYIDPQKWSPLIYNFRHYFGLGDELGKTFRSET